ncbi:GNAT family N-acetyltransferase [Murinocardiopsis flavida]|uniref:GNAT family N-acetyltransferase n=1 Tax=Murinocardiopsis flavida TaxID=645275 RepID=UPI003182D7A6
MRAHRGLGLATYAKTTALHRARERGFTRAYTDNHVRNAPMLAVNARLGYRPGGWEATYTRAIGAR